MAEPGAADVESYASGQSLAVGTVCSGRLASIWFEQSTLTSQYKSINDSADGVHEKRSGHIQLMHDVVVRKQWEVIDL